MPESTEEIKEEGQQPPIKAADGPRDWKPGDPAENTGQAEPEDTGQAEPEDTGQAEDEPREVSGAGPPAQPRCDALDFARRLIGEAIHAPDPYLDVIALTCAVTYKIDELYTAPKLLALGKMGSGKSTLLTVANYLAGGTTNPTGITALTAPSFVAEFRMNPNWTPLLDEVNHLFGEAGNNAKTSRLRTYLNQGSNRSTAWAEFQEKSVPLRISIFGAAFMAGQGLACPDDMRDRAIVMLLEKARDGIVTSDFSDENVRNKFTYGGLVLESWARSLPPVSIGDVRELNLHPKLVKRNMDVWGSLFWIAIQAGDVWLKKCLRAFELIECDRKEIIHTPEIQLILDYAEFAKTGVITSSSADDMPQLPGFTQQEVSSVQGVASGEFAAWVMSRDHGAFAWMKPGQFKQFAVSQLGPTTAFWDAGRQKSVRGWTAEIHQMNMDRAERELERIAEGDRIEAGEPIDWQDF